MIPIQILHGSVDFVMVLLYHIMKELPSSPLTSLILMFLHPIGGIKILEKEFIYRKFQGQELAKAMFTKVKKNM
jgi:hypothetical protein